MSLQRSINMVCPSEDSALEWFEKCLTEWDDWQEINSPVRFWSFKHFGWRWKFSLKKWE